MSKSEAKIDDDDTDNDDDDNSEQSTSINDLLKRLDQIELQVNQRFETIEDELNQFKSGSSRSNDLGNERLTKLCHAVDFLLEQSNGNYDTIACREMVLSLIGKHAVRPFSGRTIRNRMLCKRIRRWCLFVALVLLSLISASFYGLNQNWSYLIVIFSIIAAFVSSIGLRRIYGIIDDIR